ncbi:hypothetical protein GCM10023259_087960 [Thermocatellispora tengchongensis]
MRLALCAALPLTVCGGAAGPAPTPPQPVVVSRWAPAVNPRPTPGFDEAARRRLVRALDSYLADRPGRAALAVYDRVTGVRFGYHQRPPIMLASVAKVDILAALLLRAQERGRLLTTEERELADRMITVSDNDAARSLYAEIGGREGLRGALRSLGVIGLRPVDPHSGMSTSTPAAQIRVLETLTSPASPIGRAGRRYALRLMSSVAGEQAWGVSAAAGPGEKVALKNGWLPAEAHGGLWTVNSIGRLRGDRHDLLIAVLSERNPDLATGIATVQELARLTARAVRGP